MWFKYIIILFFISLFTSEFVFSQETPVKKDSTQLYKDIEAYSKRGKFTKFIYHLVFKPVASTLPKKSAKKKKYKKLIQKPYSAFEGKTIRHINIETLDPFGYSIIDTNAAPQNSFLINGNRMHVKSQNITIRNLLLIHQNQIFDSLLVKESERLVRTRKYVLDVSFFVKATAKNSDSVDIFIREMDKWSLLPKFAASSSNITINLNDKNFLGLGHESYNGFDWNHAHGDFAYNIKYFIPNIRNTYINSTLHFSKDQLKNSTRSFALDRPFFSPFAKWAAGVSFAHQYRKDYIHTDDSLLLLQGFKFNTQDYWAGSAIRIFKGNTESKRSTNFVSAVRFLRIRYLERPIEMYDMENMFCNEDLYLASIGISTRKYVQDKFIFKYGVTEDVPIGKVFSLTGGYQVKNNTGRVYLGARISLGNYYPWGYLSSNYEYGTFFRASHREQGSFSASVIYFTGLVELGKWKFRQFVKPQVIIGINRFSYDSLTLNDGYGMDGFHSPTLSGTSRLLFTLQTQSYSPWNFIGFHFGPFLILSLGKLWDPVTGFTNNKVYSQIALGVLIKNENLIISTFQISIAYYPLIPGKGQNVFKLNSFKTTDFDFRDFEIGKPATVVFQ
jgi:hypothetical protein